MFLCSQQGTQALPKDELCATCPFSNRFRTDKEEWAEEPDYSGVSRMVNDMRWLRGQLFLRYINKTQPTRNGEPRHLRTMQHSRGHSEVKANGLGFLKECN